MVQVIVKSDYDGYFEGLVQGWVKRKLESGEEFKHECISITAGPWRPYTVETREIEDRLNIDFYSALRTGFGSISSVEVEEIIRRL